VRFGIENPEHYRIMFMSRAEITPDEYATELLADSSAFGHLVQAIQDCIDVGRIHPIGDAFETALHVWAGVHGLTSLLVAKPGMPWPDIDRLIDDHLELCMRGLAVDPE
jgi:hypothetical protein